MSGFPSDLPYPRADNADRAFGKGAGRFEVDAGPPIQYSTTTADIETLSLLYSCTGDQRDTLIDFWRGEGARGGAWFDFTNPFTKASGQARFVAGQEPKERPRPPRFDVSIVLEFVPV